MASSDILTFDQDPPHRPGLTELGGGAKENHPKYPPDPIKHITAPDFNQLSKQAEAAGRIMPLARLFVRFNAGTPVISKVQSPGANVVADSFDLTDEGAGVTLFVWDTGESVPAGALPPAEGVGVVQNDDTEIDRIRAILTTSAGRPAARVKTLLGGVGTDANFILEIY